MKNTAFAFLALSFLMVACQLKTENQTVESSFPETVYHFDFKNFELWTLQDKQSRMSADLFPDVDSVLLHRMMPEGDAESAINVFLVHKDNHYILFDAGLGAESGGALLDNLAAIGVSPTDVDVICITHCHRDHIGGMMTHDTAVFPKAVVYLSDKELEAFGQDEMTSKVQNAYQSRLQVFKAGDTIESCVETIEASGHTPGHIVYKMGDLYIIGDLIHAAALQIPYPDCCATYDNDAKQAVATRKHFYRIFENNDVWAAGMHLPYSGVMHKFNIIQENELELGK